MATPAGRQREHFPQRNLASRWDTSSVFGPNQHNDLEERSGHASDETTNENAGATAIAIGTKDVVESVWSSWRHIVVPGNALGERW